MLKDVRIFPGSQDLAQAAAMNVAEVIQEAERSGVPAGIAISGGETPKLLFSVLAERFSSSINWNFVHFFWVDERCVPPHDPESNYGAADNLLFRRTDINPSSVHRMMGEADPGEEAVRYSEELRRFVPAVNGIPSFNLILLGMGSDGHTASVFPGRNDLFETDDLCAVTVHPEKGQKRITLTGKIINNARQIIFLISGKEKSAVLGQIFSGKDEARIFPASLVRPVHGNLTWMVDTAAAAHLKKSPES